MEAEMPVNLSIKNAPDEVVQRLKERAARHHRSLNGEVLSILEEATRPPRKLTIAEATAKLRSINLPDSPSEAVELIRRDRESH
jgi:plasmid stability protein